MSIAYTFRSGKFSRLPFDPIPEGGLSFEADLKAAGYQQFEMAGAVNLFPIVSLYEAVGSEELFKQTPYLAVVEIADLPYIVTMPDFPSLLGFLNECQGLFALKGWKNLSEASDEVRDAVREVSAAVREIEVGE